MSYACVSKYRPHEAALIYIYIYLLLLIDTDDLVNDPHDIATVFSHTDDLLTHLYDIRTVYISMA